AFSTSIGQIFIAPSPLLTPSGRGADLSVGGQSFAPQPVMQGSNVTVSLTVSNAGPGSATDVVVTDSLDAVGFVGAVPYPGRGPVLSGSTLTCNLGNLAPGSNATLTVTVQPAVAGWLTNRVTVIGNEADSNLVDNVSTAG